MTNPLPRPALKKASEGDFALVDSDPFWLPTTEGLDITVEQFNEDLRALGSSRIHQYSIDEVALYFPTTSDLARATSELVARDGYVHFNSARDRVRTAPLGTEYDVRYEFFSIENRTYRIEAMAIESGMSPLHEAFRVNNGVIVHASFKVSDMARYESALAALGGLGGKYVLGQANLSTYGRFSYWRKYSEEDYSSPWLKPRINLRDMAR